MLRYLFIDMNSYFAAVEQQDRPELRGRPVAVVPLLADSTVCIAASYEAKAYGIKTGTRVSDARQMCRDLVLVPGRHRRYVEVHQQLREAVESCLHVDRVLSIDEMACRLFPAERNKVAATALAVKIKETLRQRVGTELRCSIGVGPNITLAKVAADLHKPDGLSLLDEACLQDRLATLALQDLPGIGPRMFKRLRQRGLTSMRQLLALGRREMAHLWESKVLGERWWLLLRGEDVTQPESGRKSVGHSHVLAPRLRNPDDAGRILQRLVQKAAWRLRRYGLAARRLVVFARLMGGPTWRAATRLPALADTPSLLEAVLELWRRCPQGQPLKVGVSFHELAEIHKLPCSLFESDRRRLAVSRAVDAVNQKFGARAAYFGGVHGLLNAAPERIAFGKIPELDAWSLQPLPSGPDEG